MASRRERVAEWMERTLPPPLVGRIVYYLCIAVLLNLAAGALAGAILAGGFLFFGVIAGVFYAAPAGVVIAAIAVIRKWPPRSICAVCAGEFIGALSLGFGAALYLPAVGPPDYAFTGQIVGGIGGLVAAEILRAQAKVDYRACAGCGYNLTGNISGVCPECGQPVSQDSPAV